MALMWWMMIFSACSPNPGNDIILASGGKTAFTIITPASPSPVEAKAAIILQQYLQKITGSTLLIKKENAENFFEGQNIYLGETKASSKYKFDVKTEGFLIASDDKHVYIRGGKGQGLIYGIYELLEKYLGCHKYDEGEPFLPEAKTTRLKSNIYDLQSPRFIYREVYYPAAFNDEYLERNKLHRFEDLWGVWGHSYFKIVPPSQYFKQHPEYFAFTNGKRQPTQLCLSNKEVYNIAINYFRKQIEQKPWAEYWSISPNDDIGNCECDQCSKTDKEEGSPAGSLVKFVNQVAAEFPQVNFTTLAYAYTSRPPLNIKPSKNVYIMLSSIDAYRTAPLASEPSASVFRAHLKGWSKLTANIFIWDYTTQFTNYLAPFPNLDNFKHDMNYFVSNGVKGVFSQGSGDTYADFAELKTYLLAKLTWNPSLDTDSLINSFCRDYYKAATPHVLTYIKRIQEAITKTSTRLDIYGNPVNNYNSYLSPQLIDEYSSILDKAEAAVEGNDVVTKRVQRTRLSLEYTVLQQARFFGHEKFGFRAVDENGNVIVKPNYPERVERFVKAAKEDGVKELSEGGLSPEQYREEWKNIFSTPFRVNKASNAEVTLKYSFVPEYPAKKERTLVDAVPGYSDYSYNWLLFNGVDLVATIDLAKPTEFTTVSSTFLYDPRHWIFLPNHVMVETSDDGLVFKKIGEQSLNSPGDEDYTLLQKPVSFTLPSPVSARYIRVNASNIPALPLWRARPNKKPLIACSEIYVN